MAITISWRESSLTRFGSLKLAFTTHTITHISYSLCRSLCAYASHSSGTAAQDGARCLLFPHACAALHNLRALWRRLHVPQCSGSATKATTTTFEQPALFCELLNTHTAQLSFDYWLREPTKVFVSCFLFFFGN